jgi:hypothetical protein
MTDRELLEKAAKAADLDAVFQMYGWDEIGDGAFLDGNEPPTVWNPLDDDGDALRLAVKLEMIIHVLGNCVQVQVSTGPIETEVVYEGADPYAATRRAIVRAAAVLADAPGAA